MISRALALSALTGLALAGGAGATGGSHVAPRARLEHERIGIGQATALVIEVESSGLASVAFEPDFALDNLEVVGRPSRSDAVSSRNGRITRRDSLIWTLRPLAVGAAQVKKIRVTVGERIFVLDDLSLTVQEEPVELERPHRSSPFEDFEDLWDPFGRRRTRAPRPVVEPKIFLRAEVSPRQPWVGQQVMYTLYLFTQADVAAIDPEELPDFQGAWVHELPTPTQRGTEMVEVGGERYGRVILLRKALFPLRSGELEFGPVTARLAIRVPERSVFGPLLDRTEEVRRTSNAVTVEVQPLPPAPAGYEGAVGQREPPAPAGYEGAVGQLELAVELAPAELEVGEAATLEMTLTGEGHLQGLAAPELPRLEGVRRFPPEQGGSSRVAGTRVRGERTWTWVLVPDAPGRWKLGSIEYPYFDPTAGEYRVAASQPRVLVARAGVDEAVAEVAEGPLPATPPAPRAANGLLRSRPWLLGLAALVPVLLVLALRGVRGGGRRRREAGELKDSLRAAAAMRRPRQVADEVEAAWRRYLAGRWQIDSPGPCDGWGDLLEKRGFEPAAAEQMDRLAEDLKYLRFAPELSSTEAVRQDLYRRSLRLLRLLG